MEKYTFIFEYKRGTYIRQLTANSLNEAILKWSSLVDSFDIPGFDADKKEQLQKEVKKDTPVLLAEMENVWCLFLRIGYSSHLVNIVATK